jgi:DNA polymerase V
MSEKHGGKRENAGRKSRFEEPTKVMRIPVGAISTVGNLLEQYKASHNFPALPIQRIAGADSYSIPLYHFKIAAGATTGFASPAQDYEEEFDLAKHLVKNKPSTFAFPVGKDYDSMVDVGIMPGSIVVVDRSLKVRHSRIVVAAVDNEWVVKRLYQKNGVTKLLSENREKNYPPIVFKEGQELYIFGVVKNVVVDL